MFDKTKKNQRNIANEQNTKWKHRNKFYKQLYTTSDF